MPIEVASFVDDLTPTNPPSSDPAGQGDDHLRLIKSAVKGTFPNMGSVLGQVRRQDTALSISSTWNTNHFICSASATATVVLTLPPATSITAGFYVDVTTIGTGTVNLAASGAGSINGAAALSIPRLSTARAYFVTGTGWLADVTPHGQGGIFSFPSLTVDGTLSVSGASILSALTVNGAATLSAAVHMKSTLSVSGATTLAGLTAATLTVAGTTTLSGSVVLSLGQLKFPASQNASADANTLDDYEEGTFTPSISFVTPGNLNVAYSSRSGRYTKIGDLVTAHFDFTTSTFTHTTASGNLLLSGMPFTSQALTAGSLGYAGGVTGVPAAEQAGLVILNTSTNCTMISFNTNLGTVQNYTTTAFPTGVQKDFVCSITYKAS